MYKDLRTIGHAWRAVSRFAFASAVGLCILTGLFQAAPAIAQTPMSMTDSIQLPENWRDIKDGVGGYPVGAMLKIALRRTHPAHAPN